MKERERWLTFEERAKWGECPACGAKDGEACDANIGFPLGKLPSGDSPKEGVHLGRINNAPRRVKEVAID
jgi:hypothetical protein